MAKDCKVFLSVWHTSNLKLVGFLDVLLWLGWRQFCLKLLGTTFSLECVV